MGFFGSGLVSVSALCHPIVGRERLATELEKKYLNLAHDE